MTHASNVVAVLGPTNTGKTHRAIERMLEHRSGIMGFPLRLLAREVYDRVCAQVGEQKVALLTGEERKIPKHARYWLCTVEAMPQELDLEFLAVDEIQLAADRERGHVFSQRLLHARGRIETWFLGSMSMERAIRALIPHIRVERLTRLSTLRYGGKVSLSGLPARTAVVALSRKELYPIAEHIRQRKGGVALVLGALSPNARNAQVDLFQSGKVDYLVATDAIGMGLNLDLQHVVFASLSKFDGQRRRSLALDELGQIAGRAGRHVKDGTFYTLHNGPSLDAGQIRSIEEHRVPSKTRLVWRNHALDYSSPEALIASLREGPPRPLFQRLQKADDFEALLWLHKRPLVGPLIQNPRALALLWTVCQIPDYRKLMLDRHFMLLEEIFVQLCQRDGQLSPAWLEQKLKDADSTQGGIEVLMTRLAFVRTWSYVTHRPGWLSSPRLWQQAAREIEEKLSAALHEALTLRFLERGTASASKSSQAAKTQRRARKEPKVEPAPLQEDHPFSALSTRLASLPQVPELEPEHWIERLIDGDDARFCFGEALEICWGEHQVAQMGRGSSLVRPELRLESVLDEQVSGLERAKILRRLHAFVAHEVERYLLPVAIAGDQGSPSDAGRALAYALSVNGGLTPWSELSAEWRRGCRHGLSQVREGWLYAYCESALSPRAQALRRRLAQAANRGGGDTNPDLPAWVRGLHGVAKREVSVLELEKTLEDRLGRPGHARKDRLIEDRGPGLAIDPASWSRLLGALGWRTVGSGQLAYDPSRDRSKARSVRRRGRKRR